MRVLYANHTSRVSGGELSLIGLLDALPGEIEAAVACPEGELAERLRQRGVAVFPIRGTDGSLRLHPARTPRAIAELGQAGIQLRRAAARFGADLVHANSIRSGLSALVPVAAGRRPAIVHVRDCLPPGRASAVTLRAISRAEALIANSAYTRDRLGPAASAAHVVYNGIDLDSFGAAAPPAAEARRRLGLPGPGPVLAVIAQITPWKGQDDAIRVAAELRRRDPGLQLLLVGSARFDSAATRHDNAAYLAGLERLSEELELDDCVRFLGQREDIAEILAAVDLLLAPSWEEPFGRAIVEAMAAGVPVAATSAGGPPEILDDGRTGLLLVPRQPRLWAERCGALLADPARLEATGAAARDEALARFGIERHVAGVAAVYGAVLSGAPLGAGAVVA